MSGTSRADDITRGLAAEPQREPSELGQMKIFADLADADVSRDAGFATRTTAIEIYCVVLRIKRWRGDAYA